MSDPDLPGSILSDFDELAFEEPEDDIFMFLHPFQEDYSYIEFDEVTAKETGEAGHEVTCFSMAVHTPTNRLMDIEWLRDADREAEKGVRTAKRFLSYVRYYRVYCDAPDRWSIVIEPSARERDPDTGAKFQDEVFFVYQGFLSDRAFFVRLLECCPLPPPLDWCRGSVHLFDYKDEKIRKYRSDGWREVEASKQLPNFWETENFDPKDWIDYMP